ncbi:MAG: hypothetical protein AAGA54_28990 [Myxococcota bacterium]
MARTVGMDGLTLHRTLALSLCAALTVVACDDDSDVGDAAESSTGAAGTTTVGSTTDTTTGDPPSTSGTSEVPTTHAETTNAASSSTGAADESSTASDEGSTSTGGDVEVCAPELGLYADADCSALAEGVQAYEPAYKLWSDGIVKLRYVDLPDVIDSSDADYWTFPVGTVLWKHFETEGGQRLETRRIEKVSDDVGPSAWLFETFEWNEAGDGVTQVVNGSNNVLNTDHDIPAVADCSECHNGGQGGMGGGAATHDAVLGFSALQLNHDGTDVSLESLMDDGMLSQSIALADAAIPGSAVAQEALGTLHANCGHCHGGDSPSGGMRLYVELGIDDVTQTATYIDTVDVDIGMSPVMGIPDWRILPGDPDSSAVPWRMAQRDGDGMGAAQMPPLATEVVDDEGLAAVEAWIVSLDPL